MPEYDNTNTIAVWINRDKQSERHPDINLSVNLAGAQYDVALWKNTGSDNARAPQYRGKITPKQPQPQSALPETDEFAGDDEMPF